MALSATVDVKARVALTTTTPGSSFAWRKDGAAFATTATGTVTDQRPDKNYSHVPAQSCTELGGTFSNVYHSEHRSTAGNARKCTTIGATVSFTFTGVEFGICIDRPAVTATVVPVTYLEGQIDGSAWEEIVSDGLSATQSVIAWGKAGLTNTSHSVNVRLKADPQGIGIVFDGYFFSDRSVALGTSVTYDVTIDGGAVESVTVAPRVNRGGVLDAWADRAIELSESWPPLPDSDFRFNEYLGGLALLYLLTGKAGLVTAADKIYTSYIATRDANGLYPYIPPNDVNTRHLVVNGRTGYNFWLAYKAFSDAKWLTAADTVITTFRDDWPRLSGTPSRTGVACPGVWASTFAGGGLYEVGNQWSAACLSCALLWNESASAHYQDATLRTRIEQNAAWVIGASYDPAGRWVYGWNVLRWPNSRVYGEFTQEHMTYVSDALGIYATEISATSAGIAGFGSSEPAWFCDGQYDEPTRPGESLGEIAAYLRCELTYPASAIDRAYSAAFAGARMEYDPRGAADAVYDARNVCWDSIRPAISLYLAGELDLIGRQTVLSAPPLDFSMTMPAPSLWLRGWEPIPFERVWGGGARWKIYDANLVRFRLVDIKRFH